jgi:hypothetical protein
MAALVLLLAITTPLPPLPPPSFTLTSFRLGRLLFAATRASLCLRPPMLARTPSLSAHHRFFVFKSATRLILLLLPASNQLFCLATHLLPTPPRHGRPPSPPAPAAISVLAPASVSVPAPGPDHCRPRIRRVLFILPHPLPPSRPARLRRPPDGLSLSLIVLKTGGRCRLQTLLYVVFTYTFTLIVCNQLIKINI